MTSTADIAKDTAPRKVEARLPRGFGDRGPAELAAMRGMLEQIRATFELYGFEAVETPFIEYTEALGKFLPDQDRPNEGVFSFQDDDDQWLSLRYDLTAPLARYVAEHFDALPKPYRSYRNGYVFRNEKPGPGRFRQFMQFDADTVGAPGVSADAEMCMLMADTLEAVGIKRGDYVIKVNNRKVLDGVLEAAGVTKFYSDTMSGARDDRPGLADLMDYVRDGDTVVVWKLDRLGRNLAHILATVKKLTDRGVTLVSITDGIDSSTAAGRMMIGVLGSLAEYERELTKERTALKRAASRANGTKFGRPRKVSDSEHIATARRMKADGHTGKAIAKYLGVSRATLYRYLDEDCAA